MTNAEKERVSLGRAELGPPKGANRTFFIRKSGSIKPNQTSNFSTKNPTERNE